MASFPDSSSRVEKLYTIATDREHAYQSDPQMASAFLSSVTDILESTGISHQEALKLAISYIHFDSAHNSGIGHLFMAGVDKPHTVRGIIHLLRTAIETEVDNIGLGNDNAVTQAEHVIVEYADIVLPWLWRASQNGIQSDFVQSTVISPVADESNVDVIMVAISLSPYSRSGGKTRWSR